MQKNIIKSNDSIGIEKNFKVEAGPGAGKTFWLINHIKNVINNSDIMLKSSKVACITYTNSAVDEINTRLDSFSEKVEVSTIHNFLYKNILKPFLFLIDESSLNKEKVDGHINAILNKNILFKWKGITNQSYIIEDEKIFDCLSYANWIFDKNKNLILDLPLDKKFKLKVNPSYSIKKTSLIEYKKLLWAKGIIEHNDVLYFCYKLIKDNPRIVELIKNKFPYIFIDEFQDTSPLQTEIIKTFSDFNIIIGIIGDPAQSIYSFQGGNPDDFKNFSINDMQHFIIQSNNRSSKKIINLLNSLRKDIIQVPIREFEGNKIKLFVGDYKKATSSLVFSDFITLVRNNDLIKKLSNTNEPNVNLWNLSFFSDTNFERQEFLYQLSLSYISYKEGKFHDCIEILKRVVKKLSTTQTIPISIGLLEFIYKEKDIKTQMADV